MSKGAKDASGGPPEQAQKRVRFDLAPQSFPQPLESSSTSEEQVGHPPSPWDAPEVARRVARAEEVVYHGNKSIRTMGEHRVPDEYKYEVEQFFKERAARAEINERIHTKRSFARDELAKEGCSERALAIARALDAAKQMNHRAQDVERCMSGSVPSFLCPVYQCFAFEIGTCEPVLDEHPLSGTQVLSCDCMNFGAWPGKECTGTGSGFHLQGERWRGRRRAWPLPRVKLRCDLCRCPIDAMRGKGNICPGFRCTRAWPNRLSQLELERFDCDPSSDDDCDPDLSE